MCSEDFKKNTKRSYNLHTKECGNSNFKEKLKVFFISNAILLFSNRQQMCSRDMDLFWRQEELL